MQAPSTGAEAPTRGKAPIAKLPASILSNASEYTPETQRMLQDLARLGQEPPDRLIRMVYQSLFGDPTTVQHLVRLWFRTLHRGAVMRSDPLKTDPDDPSATSADLAARLLPTLASAPALACLRHHHIGGHERHAVFFYPFGTQGPVAPHLSIPLAPVDVRLVRALQLLANNPWVFRDISEDPVFGCITYGCCAYNHEAQEKLDHYRPSLVAAAVRAMVTQTRLELARSERLRTGASASANRVGRWNSHAASRMVLERQVLAQPPTYIRAMLEQRVLSRVKQLTIPVAARLKSDPEQQAAHDLLVDAFHFVQEERTAQSLGHNDSGIAGYSSDMPAPTLSYSLLPADSQIRAFAAQTSALWDQALHQARQVKRAAAEEQTA